MNLSFTLLKTGLLLPGRDTALLCFLSAFIVSIILIPIVISLVKRYKLLDKPNDRKLHQEPVPTMGGIAIVIGLLVAAVLWIPFGWEVKSVCFLFSLISLFVLGVMDDRLDLPARYKFLVQIALAGLMAVSGVRINSFEGVLGIYDIHPVIQYLFTILTIVGIVNALNLIDGIDGLAGSLAFMSLMTLGIFLAIGHNMPAAFIAFALAGSILGFLYFNFNPAKIFMGDTGSLVIGFVIAVLGIELTQTNLQTRNTLFPNGALFFFGLVLIPVFDTIRVFATRMMNGKSPFSPDKTHIHHLILAAGFSHVFAVRLICGIHAVILSSIYLLKDTRSEWIVLYSLLFMSVITYLLKQLHTVYPHYERLRKAVL